jgi:hypothetical protein
MRFCNLARDISCILPFFCFSFKFVRCKHTFCFAFVLLFVQRVNMFLFNFQSDESNKIVCLSHFHPGLHSMRVKTAIIRSPIYSRVHTKCVDVLSMRTTPAGDSVPPGPLQRPDATSVLASRTTFHAL